MIQHTLGSAFLLQVIISTAGKGTILEACSDDKMDESVI